MARSVTSVYLPCETELCNRPSKWYLSPSWKLTSMRALTPIGQGVGLKTRSRKSTSSHTLTRDASGSSKGTSRPASTMWTTGFSWTSCENESPDRKVLRLVKLFLQSGVITEMGEGRSTLTGTPQGGIISPLLANLYLSILDEHYARRWREMGRYSSLGSICARKGYQPTDSCGLPMTSWC